MNDDTNMKRTWYGLKLILMKRNIEQQQLADQLNIDRVTFNRVVNGRRVLSFDLAEKITDALNIDFEQLY